MTKISLRWVPHEPTQDLMLKRFNGTTDLFKQLSTLGTLQPNQCCHTIPVLGIFSKRTIKNVDSEGRITSIQGKEFIGRQKGHVDSDVLKNWHSSC